MTEPLTKETLVGLVRDILDRHGHKTQLQQSEQVVNAMLEEISHSIRKGYGVKFVGHFTLKAHEKPARQGVDPRGNPYTTLRSIRFKLGGKALADAKKAAERRA